MSSMDDAHFSIWKEKMAPLLYDWISHHNLTWPTQTCRWGAKLSENTYKYVYRMYFSEQTDDSEPQKLVVANMDICKPHVASAEVVSNWIEFQKCPYVREHKVIFHPGEINKVREVPGHPQLVVTHTDAADVYVWNLDRQPPRTRGERGGRIAASVPDLVLAGHEAPAQFPLAATSEGPHVASGGQDKLVLVWCLADKLEALLGPATPTHDLKSAPRLQPRARLAGHSNTIEDLVFLPGSSQRLVSVGDDHQILLWDTRAGTAPTTKVEQAHGKQDIQCVDWNAHATHLIATGAQDGSLRVWDTRKMGGAKDHVFQAKSHTGGIIRLEWHPHQQDVLATGGEDRIVMVWRLGPIAGGAPLQPLGDDPPGPAAPSRAAKAARTAARPPPELIFQHAGHRRGKVVDFQWHPHTPWTMLSVSDDAQEEERGGGPGGGGTLQVWRMNDFIYRPEAEVVAELEAHREYILEGRNPPQPKVAIPDKPAEPVEGAAAAAAAAGVADGSAAASGPSAVAPQASALQAGTSPPKTEGLGPLGAGAQRQAAAEAPSAAAGAGAGVDVEMGEGAGPAGAGGLGAIEVARGADVGGLGAAAPMEVDGA